MAFCQSLDEQAMALHPAPDLKAAPLLPVYNVEDISTPTDGSDSLSAYRGSALVEGTKAYASQAIELTQRVECETIKRLETPRTREACRRLGIRLEDLQAKTLQDFKCVGDSIDRVKMRCNHYETKRQTLLKKVVQERGLIVAERLEPRSRSGASKLQSLQLMEDLLDKEAKRLEKELRSQVRCHSAMEKENDNILQKQQALEERIKYRDERQHAKKQIDEERGSTARSELQQRNAKVVQKRAQMEQEDQTRQATYMSQLMDDEERLMEFGKEKESGQRERVERRELHKEQIDKLRELEEQDRMSRAVELECKMEEKSENLRRRNEEMALERDLKAEEQNLRITDAIERKNAQDRQQAYKREQVSKQLREDESRIALISGLKDQIVEQRKLRQKQLVSQNRSSTGRTIALNTAGPGPAAYNTREAYEIAENHNRGGVVISSGNTRIPVPNSIDDMIERSRQNPPPGCYDPKVLSKGDRMDLGGSKLATFSNAESRTYIEEQELRASKIPGPGAYAVESKGTTVGTKIRRDYISGPRDCTSWVSSNNTPGPAAYAIDPFLRQQRVMKNQRSLPTLYPGVKSA